MLHRFAPALVAAGLLAAAAPPALAQEQGGDHYEQVVDLTFPTAQVSGRTPIARVDGTTYGFVDDYENPRGNTCGIHRATDVFGEAGQPVYAAVGGTVTFMPDPKPAYGWMIRVRGDDGRTYSYVHLGHDEGPADGAYAAGLKTGDKVARGQHIGYLGSSGNASEELPHLHFEVNDPSVSASNEWDCPYVNPYFSLRDAVARSDFAAAVEPAPAELTAPSESAEVDRVAGSDRVATTLRMAALAFDSAEEVVIAPARSFPEAALAGPLAAALDAPVLITWSDGLDDRVAAELRRWGTERVVLVGGLDALSDRVTAELVSKARIAPEEIRRIWGADAFETAARVADEVWALQGARTSAVVALGDHPDPDRAWPDALTSSWYGAVAGAPLLLVDHGRLPETTAGALEGVGAAVVVGGRAAVTEEVAEQLEAIVGEVRRLSGSDRFATAVAVAEDLLAADVGVRAERVWASTGYGWADALAAAQPVAVSGDLLVLVDGEARGRDASIDGWFADRRGDIAAGRVIGGTAAVSDAAMELLLERIG